MLAWSILACYLRHSKYLRYIKTYKYVLGKAPRDVRNVNQQLDWIATELAQCIIASKQLVAQTDGEIDIQEFLKNFFERIVSQSRQITSIEKMVLARQKRCRGQWVFQDIEIGLRSAAIIEMSCVGVWSTIVDAGQDRGLNKWRSRPRDLIQLSCRWLWFAMSHGYRTLTAFQRLLA